MNPNNQPLRILYPNHTSNFAMRFADDRAMWPLWIIPASAVKGFLDSMIRYKKSHITNATFDANGTFRSAEIEIEHPREGEFIKIYLEGYEKLKFVGGFTPIVAALCNHMSYAQDGSLIYTNKSLLEDIAESCNVSVSQVRHTISKLVKADIFRRLAPNKYQVNPHVIAKGYESDVIKLRKQVDDPLAGTPIIIKDKQHDIQSIVLAFPDGDTLSVREDDLSDFMKEHGYEVRRHAEFSAV